VVVVVTAVVVKEEVERHPVILKKLDLLVKQAQVVVEVVPEPLMEAQVAQAL
jgi:hypothetical protein